MKKSIILTLLLVAVALLVVSCARDPQTAPAEITEIKLSEAKTDFAFAEEFSSETLKVTAVMSNGSEKVLEENEFSVVCEDYNSMKVGTYQALVKISGTQLTKSYDVKVNPANKLKVLMIGNSYADDTINYAYEIAKSVGIPAENILIADIYVGGCSLKTHLSNAQKNAKVYRFGLERAGWFDGESYKNWTMEKAIKYADWDFITFQQSSGESGVAASYSSLQELMDYVYKIATDTKNNPNANPNVKFVWHQTWAYQQNTAPAGFANYRYKQMTMYNSIISCMKKHVLNKNFAAIIPNGTAIQNARTSSIGDTFARDESNHLSYGAGRYIASMTLVSVLTGRDMSTMTWTPTDNGFTYKLTEKEITICKESVANAILNPLKITNSKYPASN